jgi:ubiquitin-like protein Pup
VKIVPKYVQKHKNTGYECKGQEMAEEDATAQQRQREEGEGGQPSDYTDDLLDEIDSVLEEEEDFAANYIQKGGQ